MNGILLDTHSLIWFYNDPELLSAVATHTIHECIAVQKATIHISAITLIELEYLTERFRIPQNAKLMFGM